MKSKVCLQLCQAFRRLNRIFQPRDFTGKAWKFRSRLSLSSGLRWNAFKCLKSKFKKLRKCIFNETFSQLASITKASQQKCGNLSDSSPYGTINFPVKDHVFPHFHRCREKNVIQSIITEKGKKIAKKINKNIMHSIKKLVEQMTESIGGGITKHSGHDG